MLFLLSLCDFLPRVFFHFFVFKFLHTFGEHCTASASACSSTVVAAILKIVLVADWILQYMRRYDWFFVMSMLFTLVLGRTLRHNGIKITTKKRSVFSSCCYDTDLSFCRHVHTTDITTYRCNDRLMSLCLFRYDAMSLV